MGTEMRKEYDFSNGVRGAVVQPDPGKVRITIRLDENQYEKATAIAWTRTSSSGSATR